MVDLSKKYALLESGEIEPLQYEDGEPRTAYKDEDGSIILTTMCISVSDNFTA